MEREALSKTIKLAGMKRGAFEFYTKVECTLAPELIERLQQYSLNIKSLLKGIEVTVKGEDIYYGSWAAVREAHEVLELMWYFNGTDQLRDIRDGREHFEEIKGERKEEQVKERKLVRDDDVEQKKGLSSGTSGSDRNNDTMQTHANKYENEVAMKDYYWKHIICHDEQFAKRILELAVKYDVSVLPDEDKLKISAPSEQGLRIIHQHLKDQCSILLSQMKHVQLSTKLSCCRDMHRMKQQYQNLTFVTKQDRIIVVGQLEHMNTFLEELKMIESRGKMVGESGRKATCEIGGMTTGVSGGKITGESGGKTTGVSGGKIIGESGGKTTGVSGGKITDESGGKTTGESGGKTIGESGGKTTGVSGGKITGETGGKTTGESGGTITGETGGKTTGESGGKTIGESGGKITGESGGKITGESGGKITGETGGKTTGESGGKITGETGGKTTGESGGKTIGESGGKITGESGGKITGESGGKTTGESGGKTTGETGGKKIQESRCSEDTSKKSEDKRQAQAYSADANSQPGTRFHRARQSTTLLNTYGFLVKQHLHVVIYKADITKLHVDAIVNAANGNLQHQGGIAKAISSAAGPEMEKEGQQFIKKRGALPVSENIITTGGRLPCQYVIHAVGPRWQGEEQKERCLTLLFDTFINVLRTAGGKGFRSIAIPAISSGIYCVPGEEVAKIICEVVTSMPDNMTLEEIHLIDTRNDIVHLMCTAFLEKKKEKENLDIILLEDLEKSKKIWSRLNERSVLLYDRVKVLLCQKDVTQLSVEAIVCFSDDKLSCKSGLSKELATTYGKMYNKECKKQVNKCKPTLTGAITVNAKNFPKIIHVVMPIYRNSDQLFKKYDEGQYRELLNAAFHCALEEARKQGVHHLALSVFGADQKDVQLQWVVEEMCNALKDNARHEDQLKEVCIFDKSPEVLNLVWKELNRRQAVIKKLFDPDGKSNDLHSTGVDKTSEANELGSKIFKAEVPAEGSEVDNPVDGSAGEEQKSTIYSSDYRKKKITEQESEMHVTNMQSPKTASTLKEEKEKITEKPSGDEKNKEEGDICVICMNKPENPKILEKCKHVFCTNCIDASFTKLGPKCPCCSTMYGTYTGNQPLGGFMSVRKDKLLHLPGYEQCGTIIITYNIPSGIQGLEHPHPGRWYCGTERTAYLPDNKEGNEILGLLKKAFDARLIFTVGRSVTTGTDDVVTWNDIHHKTSMTGGSYCYPDPTYLARVRQELAAKGIK